MRLFIAIPVHYQIKEALQPLLAPYNLPETKFIPLENLHITLHFIGEYPSENLPVLTQNLKALAEEIKPFPLTLQEIAPGPKLKNPRLIWARFKEEPAFKALALGVCQAIQTKPDHPKFIPHITVARFQKNKPIPRNLPITKPVKNIELMATSLAIWESTLGSPHPTYKIIADFPFLAGEPENL